MCERHWRNGSYTSCLQDEPRDDNTCTTEAVYARSTDVVEPMTSAANSSNIAVSRNKHKSAFQAEMDRRFANCDANIIRCDITERNGEFEADIEIQARHLWSSKEAVLGKTKAEQKLAELICSELGTAVGKSAKESLNVYCDQRSPRIAKPKYFTYENPANKQEYFALAWFEGLAAAWSCRLNVKAAPSRSESEAAARQLIDAVLERFDVELTSQVADKQSSTGACDLDNNVNEQGTKIISDKEVVSARNYDVVKSVSSTESCADATPPSEAKTAVSGPNYVAELNEFSQCNKLGQADYTCEEVDKKFRCVVSWPQWKVKVAHEPKQYFSTVKEAEKQVAKLALATHFEIDESVEKSKNRLNEIFQKTKSLLPEYSAAEKHPDNTSYSSSVSFIVKKSFPGKLFENKRKAKDDAAKIALEKLSTGLLNCSVAVV